MEILTNFYKYLGDVTATKKIIQNGPYILHLFDTPSYAYFLLDRILSSGSVIAIIHSGNLSSTLKLKQEPSSIKAYEEHLHLFNALLMHHKINQVGITLSSNDHLSSIKRCVATAQVFKELGQVNVLNRPYYFSYDPKNFSQLSMHEHASQFLSPYPVSLRKPESNHSPFVKRERLCFELIHVYENRTYPIHYRY